MKKLLYKILLFACIIFPVITFAETPQYQLKKEYLSYEGTEKGYKKIIGIIDDDVYVDSSYGIYKHDKDLKNVKSISLSYYNHYFEVDEKNKNLYGILGSNNNYYIVTLDSNLNKEKEAIINFEDASNISIKSIKKVGDNYYISYQFGTYSNYEYHASIIDKEGNFISDNKTNKLATLYNVNNKIYYIENYTKYTEVYMINNSGEIKLIKKIDNINIESIEYDKYAMNIVTTYYDQNNSDRKKNIMTFDSDFNKVISDEKNYFSEDFSQMLITERYLVFLMSSSNKNIEFNIYDKDLKKSELVTHTNIILDNSTGYSSHYSIYANNNSIFITGYCGDYYSTYRGDYIARYDNEDLYLVKQEITEGEGVINQNLYSAFLGEEVTFSATPSEGYELKELKLFDESGKEIKTDNGKFNMPSKNVIIKAKFTKKDGSQSNQPTIPSDDSKNDNPQTSGNLKSLIPVLLLISTISLLIICKKKNLLE